MKLKGFLILIFSFIVRPIVAQDIQKTFEYANLLYQKQDYDGATDAFKRVLFFDAKGEFGMGSYQKIANSLYALQRYEEALSYYDLAYFLVKNDTLKSEITLKKASCFLLIKNYQYTQMELLSLSDSLPANLEKERNLYAGMMHFALNEFSESEENFLALTDSNSIDKRHEIQQLFKKNEKINKLKPKTAKTLSMIVPGLGQIYAGDIKNGLNSFVLEGGLLYFTYLSALNSSAIDAIFTYLPWFQRYYTGGYNRAEAIAKNQIKKRRNKVFNELLDVVEK